MLEKTSAALKRMYTTVFSQVASPCGRYLAVSDNYGSITVFSTSDSAGSTHLPFYQFLAGDGPVYSLASTDKFLITAGTGFIKGFEWTAVIAKSASKPAWCLVIPNGNNYDTPEANTIAISEDDRLFAGCGDNLVHVFNLDSGSLETSLRGHTGYVHDVSLWKERCVSAGEDGNILVWDCRAASEPQHTIQPWKNDLCVRPERGQFQKCVSLDGGEWLVCGGGPKMSLWHLQSLSCTTVFESESFPNHVTFHDDGLVSGGTLGKVEYWNLDGSVKAQVACKPNNIFSICVNSCGGTDVLSVAGNGSFIDVFTSIAYPSCSYQVR